MKLKFVMVCFITSFSSFAQIDTELLKLIKETNFYFKEHQRFHPDFGMISLDEVNLSLDPLEDLRTHLKEYKLSIKDSVESLLFVEYYSMKIRKNIGLILRHPAALELNFLDYFDKEYCLTWVSEDGKFAQISYDANNGGTYHMQETSLIYKLDNDSLIFAHLSEINSRSAKNVFSNFRSDGYYVAHEIRDSSITKYLLIGGVKGCSLCYYEWLSLVYFHNNEFVFDFDLKVGARRFGDIIEYDKDKKEIKIQYETNDLTETCECRSKYDDFENDDFEPEVISEGSSCYCLFNYNGKTFELYDKKVSDPIDD